MNNKNIRQEIKDYSQKAWAYLKSDYPYKELKFEHISYETPTTKSYKKFIKENAQYWTVIKEISHSGRTILLTRLNDPVHLDGLIIDIIEVQEAKPKAQVEKEGIDHIAFTVNDFDDFYNDMKKNGKMVEDVKQISDFRFFKIKEHDVKLEFKNMTMISEAERPKVGVEQLNAKSDLEKLLKDEKAKRLKTLADFENYKKRIQEEKIQLGLLANVTLLERILDVLDDFERAKESITKEAKKTEGLDAIFSKLKSVVNEFGVIEIVSNIGDKFDPTIHEALGTVAVTDEGQINIIQQIVAKGYKLKDQDRVVRHTRVIVGKK